jgi:IPT/TIG domain
VLGLQGVDLLQVRKIFVNGTNFGALARLQGTGVQLFVDSQPYVSSSPPVDSLWVSNAIRYSAWVDTSIVAFTLQQSSFVRLRLVTRDFGTGFVTNVTSNVLPFQDVSPQITGVLSGSLPPTSGSTNLVFSCSHLETAETISVTVGGSPCPVLNPLTGAVVPANNVPAMLYAVYGANNVEYPVTCVVPPGQGGAVGVILTRDTSPSAPWLIAYAGPTVDTVTATDPNAPTVTTPALGTLHLAPTIGGMFTFTGSNFGLAPVVNVTSGTYSKLIGFVPGFPNYEPGTSRSHTVLTFPVPPGEGKGWLIWVVVGDQQWANPVAFSYKPPVVTSIISGSSTAGDGIATLNGYNFGVSVVLGAPPPTVSLLRGDGKVFACNPLAPVVPACAVPVPSRSHTEIQFVVPPGAGKSLNVLLNVGGQSVTIPGFSYAPPLISAMIAVGIGPGGSNVTVSGIASNPRPIMYVPAAGNFELQLYGANFGPGNDAPFVFTRWQAKADKVPIGDRLETFVGEGEVFTGDLLFVDHTFVRFRVSPGLGTRDVIMQAYDQVPVINGQYQHQAPQLTSMSLNLFPTDSGVAVTVTGSNFGPPTVARSSFVPIPLPLSDFNRPTTGLLVIAFGTKCAVSACSEAQCMPEALKSCDAGAITSHSDSSVVFTSLPGIGVDLNVTMSVLEPVLVPPGTRNLTGTGEATFSYLPPSVDFISPAVLSMDSRTTGYLLEVHGDNVGLLGDLVLPGDSVVQVLVDNATCDNAQRRVVSNPVSGPMTLLACSLNQTTTGFKNMTLFAARQWGPTLNATSFNALHVVCSANYYAMQGEVCLPCPPGASCAGFVNNVLTLPVALSGWYNLNGTVIGPANKTLFDLCPDKRGLSGRLDKTCVVPCQPTEACTGNNLCAVGYKDAGPNYRCSVCADNYYMSAGLCVKCPSAPWVLIVAFIAVSILLAIGGWILSRKNVNIAFMSIGVDYFQVLAMFAQSKVKVLLPCCF